MQKKKTRQKQELYTDINPSFFLFKAPKYLHPYIFLCRLDRPTGTFLLFWPCVWGLSLGSFPSFPNISDLFLFFLGAFLMRSAGCCFNDIVDKKLDASVERTALRPLAQETLSVKKAWVTIFLLLSASFLILVMFNLKTIIFGISSLILVIVYPYMKRVTYWPQLFLGFTFNWGVIIGSTVKFTSWKWTSILSILLVYVSGIFWTLAYDTIYAHQDKNDDFLVGIKSLALKMKEHSRLFIYICYSIQITCLISAGLIMNFHWAYILLCSCAISLQVRCVKNLNFDDKHQALQVFKHHIVTGGIISIGFLIA